MNAEAVRPMQFRGYDLIGDVHGCARTLEILLQRLGYTLEEGVYRHPERQAVFIGDIIDRGPRIRDALRIVRDMVDVGSAQIVMGNHEYYALAWSTRVDDSQDAEPIRPHTARHRRIIRQTLNQFADYPDDWADYLDWFQTLPLFLEFDGIRCVHACWDQRMIDQFLARNQGNRMSREFLIESAEPGSFANRCLDRLLRGTTMRLPDGRSITSDDGYTRFNFRTKFWARNPQTIGDIVFQPDALPPEIEDRSLNDKECTELLCYTTDLPPLFIGHYWLEGKPEPLTSNLVCLDYSAVKYGSLVAYQYDGEEKLSADKFVWVEVARG